MNQDAAPLFEALQDYVRRGVTPFHTPGHKQGRGAPAEWQRWIGRQALSIDLTEVPGLDNLHDPTGPIAAAQALAADAFGAQRTFFLVGGSTAGVQALILATCPPGSKLLVGRNCHQSVLSGMILAGARPVYMRGGWDARLDLPLPVAPEELAQALRQHPDARAVLVTEPAYHGGCGDLARLAALAHAAGLPLLVDAAHGAHFRFHAGLPVDALSAGADGAVHSLHKTAGSLTQSSLLHLQGNRIEPGRVQAMLRLTQSSSPSYLLMASLDLARRDLALHGTAKLGRALALAARVRQQVACYDFPGGDPLKLVLPSGPEAAERLLAAGVAVEMAGPGYVLALLTLADDDTTVGRLASALPPAAEVPRRLGPPPSPDVVLAPREAFFADRERLPLAHAVGRVAAESLGPYPPGVPLVAPGERITAEVAAYLDQAMRLEHIQVVKE